jgi:hypothetical protein
MCAKPFEFRFIRHILLLIRYIFGMFLAVPVTLLRS